LSLERILSSFPWLSKFEATDWAMEFEDEYWSLSCEKCELLGFLECISWVC
jgi:hypothetical protein